ncbi:MAG: formate/nitrite transporter family protein [Actinobacteria bacterium]|nr:formate/nitrite transporter family protein [Actinomycetota bacterium]
MAATRARTAEPPRDQVEEDGVESAFRMTVDEGVRRLERGPGALLATGLVGGIDVSVGVFGLLVVLHLTESKVLASLAFSIGFIALTLANSELFTENFLVPIAALVARRQGYYSLGRLWGGTAVTNLVGGWVIAALIISGFPDLRATAVELGAHFVEIGIGWRSLSMAMLGGAIITIMTWMIEGTRSQGAKIVAAVVAGFLLTVGEINHCIVASLEMFAGLIAGASYGYLDWLTVFLWAALGNMIGGIGLVTILRFAQIGGDALREEQRNQRAAAGGT